MTDREKFIASYTSTFTNVTTSDAGQVYDLLHSSGDEFNKHLDDWAKGFQKRCQSNESNEADPKEKTADD